MKDVKHSNRTLTLKVKVPVAVDGDNQISMRMDVKGMMRVIENMVWKEKSQKDIKLMLTEYSKFYLLDKLGVKVTPLQK